MEAKISQNQLRMIKGMKDAEFTISHQSCDRFISFAFDRLSILLIFLKFDSGQCR